MLVGRQQKSPSTTSKVESIKPQKSIIFPFCAESAKKESSHERAYTHHPHLGQLFLVIPSTSRVPHTIGPTSFVFLSFGTVFCAHSIFILGSVLKFVTESFFYKVLSVIKTTKSLIHLYGPVDFFCVTKSYDRCPSIICHHNH